jgi:hypothetical protein
MPPARLAAAGEAIKNVRFGPHLCGTELTWSI